MDDPIDRIDRLERWSEDMERRFVEAFPDGDHNGHRHFHELWMKDIEAREKLTAAIKEKTIGGLFWGAVVVICIALWQYIREQLKG